ncbi:sigma-70 family RNA polymerase sigma factor [Gandjariella thermophila]|uniref:RNA polymerase principal sigma factor HrdC n=1 Tax=Gandjariella thermophila TaxID=1931992 RepID=A0A4D4J3P8_9PSEU|nr:sigma-70 family RNA polymerase sigma factor [Gandjariella thermophila]GDY29702.1 RNA polymerase principal sigma factor HrdC [Gandjariella thermophila]
MLERNTEAPRRNAATHDEPDLAHHYLKDIGSTPLLTAEEEVDLAKRIEAGVYAAEQLRRDAEGEEPLSAAPITPDRRRELAAVAADGRRAKDHMIRANLRLVVSAAKKHAHRGLPFLDVIQEGNLGLIRAVEKFDYAKGYKFSTYAMWWIRQAIERGLAEQTRVIRLPVHVVEELSRIGRIDRQLSLRLGREPTVQELAEETGTPAHRVVELRRAAREAISLDTPIGEDGETRVADLIEDTETLQAVEALEHQALGEDIRAVVNTLPPREARIVTLRYGLHGGQPQTLQEVAEQVGLTRERVRQLEKAAPAELRNPDRRPPLLEWAG